MLLRWIVNNYLREAAEGKVREVVGNVVQRELPKQLESSISRPPTPEPRAPTSASGDEFLPCDVVFLFGLGVESGGLVDLLKGAEASRHAHGRERAGKLAGREVVIVESGVGGRAAGRATAEAIKFYRPRWVISAGFACGLEEQLRRGHVVMANEVKDLSGQRMAISLNLDPQTVAATKGLHVGRLLSVNDIIRRPVERRRLAADHEAIACDMESFAVALACQQKGAQFLAARIITDYVDDELPPEIEHLLAQSTVAAKLGAAAGAVLRRFNAAKDLWKLREDALKASDRLAKFLAGVVEQLPSTNHS